MRSWNAGNEDWRQGQMDPRVDLVVAIDRMDFFPYCCIVCRRSAVHCAPVKLSHCGKCKRVHYCSRECQKKDFKKHKYLCQLMHDVPLQSDRMTKPRWGAYLKRHLRAMRAASESFYGKDIWMTGFSVWMYQPHCQTCYVQENIKVCEKCGCVARCSSPDCVESFHETHTAQSCESHCIRLAAYVMAKQQGNYLKISSQSRNTITSNSESTSLVCPLPSSWGSYWAKKIGDYEVPEALLRLPPVLAMLTDSMSSIFTAIHSLQQLHSYQVKNNLPTTILDSSTLCIHFIGTDILDAFGAQAGVFEEFLHWFPHVTQVELVLIGPDMQADIVGDRRLINDQMCSPCSAKGCNVYLTCIRSLYHEAVEQGKLSLNIMPTIAVLCNSGLHEQCSTTPVGYASMWAPTLELLYDNGTPIVATSYTAEEVNDDWEQLTTVLKNSCSKESLTERLVVPPSRNPFRGLLPMPDTLSDNEFFFNNNHYFVVAGQPL
jgi:hypothetical protein